MDSPKWFAFFPIRPFSALVWALGRMLVRDSLTGETTFLLAEGEWARMVLESGPLFGLAFLLWRLAVAIRIGLLCIQSVRRSQPPAASLIRIELHALNKWAVRSANDCWVHGFHDGAGVGGTEV